MENFRLGNTTITFSDDFEILNEFRQAVKAETDGISPGTDISKGIKEGRKPNVDRLAHGYTDYLNSIFTEELVPLAVNFLVHYDIYDCSEELFIRKYQEKYFLMDNRPEFKKFLQEYTAISDEYSQKKAYQKVYRANRSKWIGGGFGIKGAIKGSIDATILNTATGLFRGIGDGIDDFYSSVEFKNQKEDLLTENLFDNIDSAFHSCCLGVVLACETEYESHKNIKCTWDYNSNHERSNALFQNAKTRIADPEKRLAIISEAIQLNPYNKQFYEYLYQDTTEYKDDVLTLAEYVGFSLYDLRVSQLLKEVQPLVDKLSGSNNVSSSILTEYSDALMNLGLKYNFFSSCDPAIISSHDEENPDSINFIKSFLSQIFQIHILAISTNIKPLISSGSYTFDTHQDVLLQIEHLKKKFNIDMYNIPLDAASQNFIDYVMRGNDLTSSESTKSTSSNNQHNISASPNSDTISATELHSTPSALPETIFCPHCGKKIQRNSKFCCFCGSKINYKK